MREAMTAAMHRDPRVFLMGADVGAYGGCFAVSKGMLQEFGPERVIGTPLSESSYTGAGIGAAMNGMLPIVEIMTCNFSLLALDQILNNAATILHMSGGLFNVPVVVRMATGGGKRLGAQHSHTFDGWYAHIPGLKVLAPATVEDARGMLESALADPDPVLIFENSLLYNVKAQLPANAGPVDIAKARVRRARRGHHRHRLRHGAREGAGGGREARRRGHPLRGDRPARAAPAGRRHDHGVGGQDPPRPHRGRGLAERQHRRRRSAPASWSRPSTTSTGPWSGCAAPRCPCRIPRRWKTRPFPRWRPSSRR